MAKKLQPTIIFIDEIDSFLRERKSNDHEATSMMKAEFMTLWDGMNSGEAQRIIILGATNRPNDIDKAILRRMPKRFEVALPNLSQRVKVLELVLDGIALDPDCDIVKVAEFCNGYSNSDIKELCRNAVMVPVRDAIRQAPKAGDGTVNANNLRVRRVNMHDFLGFVDSLYSTASTLYPVAADID